MTQRADDTKECIRTRFPAWAPTTKPAGGALAEAIAEAKREARAAGLRDEEVDAGLDAWRAGH
jgi:hypothetical protein